MNDIGVSERGVGPSERRTSEEGMAADVGVKGRCGPKVRIDGGREISSVRSLMALRVRG